MHFFALPISFMQKLKLTYNVLSKTTGELHMEFHSMVCRQDLMLLTITPPFLMVQKLGGNIKEYYTIFARSQPNVIAASFCSSLYITRAACDTYILAGRVNSVMVFYLVVSANFSIFGFRIQQHTAKQLVCWYSLCPKDVAST